MPINPQASKPEGEPENAPAFPDVSPQRLKVLLCGYGHQGLALLQGLCAHADLCEVVGVYRWSSHPDGRNDWDPIEQAFQKLVEESGFRDIQCPGMNSYEFSSLLEKLKPHVVLVGSWGEILKAHLLERSEPLFINCHPSKLPAHRGANPYVSVIRMGESETGVTFHRMVRAIDAGPIIIQRCFALEEHDTGDTVRRKCAAVAFEAMRELLEMLHAHCCQGMTLPQMEQNSAQSSYYPILRPEDGLIRWELKATEIYRQCRALYPWIPACSYLEGHRLVWFFSPRFVPRPLHLPVEAESGTILALQKGRMILALHDADWVLEVPTYQLEGWPIWLSRLLTPFVFRVGKRFCNPH